jgi:aminoglycoside phosphotransferase (APT) family kinase protein
MNEIAVIEHHGRTAVRKRYSAADTRLYKCFGSGARNEGLLGGELRDLVPAELAITSSDGYDEVVLEWRSGSALSPDQLDREPARLAGMVLARIHGHGGRWYGSIDGRHRYEVQADAFATRWSHALSVLAGADASLARAAERWGRQWLPRLTWVSPTLVHGDFGATNLLWTGAKVGAVLDWEYARFGDPREDWAKVAMGARFEDPNSFGQDDAVIAALRDGYLAGGGSPAAYESVALYEAYYAAIFGVFMEDPNRLGWLAELVTSSGSGGRS